jgi:CheY-like chemotaxis protein
MNSHGRTIAEILLVEDEDADIRAVKRAFKNSKLANNLHVVRDGEDALEYLHQRGAYSQAIRPDLILLDINMPKKNGREVLALIKADPHLKVIPVAVMTSSEAEEDILRSYSLGANCYIRKPVDFEGLNRVVEMLETFWFEVVTLAPVPRLSRDKVPDSL